MKKEEIKRIDMHVHSIFSLDGLSSPKELIEKAKKNGLDGLVISDHGTVQGGLEGYKLSKYMEDFIVIPGSEITTREGDILALGIFEEIPSGLSAKETVYLIKKKGGLAIAAHPFHPLGGINELVYELDLDAIEARNAGDPVGSLRSERAAKKLKLPGTGSSDAHIASEVGKAYTRVYTKNLELKEILKSIKEGKISVGGLIETGNSNKERLEG